MIGDGADRVPAAAHDNRGVTGLAGGCTSAPPAGFSSSTTRCAPWAVRGRFYHSRIGAIQDGDIMFIGSGFAPGGGDVRGFVRRLRRFRCMFATRSAELEPAAALPPAPAPAPAVKDAGNDVGDAATDAGMRRGSPRRRRRRARPRAAAGAARSRSKAAFRARRATRSCAARNRSCAPASSEARPGGQGRSRVLRDDRRPSRARDADRDLEVDAPGGSDVESCMVHVLRDLRFPRASGETTLSFQSSFGR